MTEIEVKKKGRYEHPQLSTPEPFTLSQFLTREEVVLGEP